jgi:hypothetical protein
MLDNLHKFFSHLNIITEIVLNLHVLALLIINITRTPGKVFDAPGRYSLIGRMYRLIELFAGLISPLAKK